MDALTRIPIGVDVRTVVYGALLTKFRFLIDALTRSDLGYNKIRYVQMVEVNNLVIDVSEQDE
jgi:hypothetical protein